MSSFGRVICVSFGLVLAALLLGTQLAASRDADSFNLGIGKEKGGPFKSSAIDSDLPDGNPQQMRRTVEVGTVGKFWVRLKNRTTNDDGVYITADGTDFDYQVTYSLDGDDVTSEVVSPDCTQFILGPKESAVFKMRAIPTGADPGDVAFFGMSTVEPSCDEPTDAVYARVKVAP